MNELNALQNSLRTAIMKNPYSGIRVIAQVVESSGCLATMKVCKKSMKTPPPHTHTTHTHTHTRRGFGTQFQGTYFANTEWLLLPVLISDCMSLSLVSNTWLMCISL
jgi:hypothetical protein